MYYITIKCILYNAKTTKCIKIGNIIVKSIYLHKDLIFRIIYQAGIVLVPIHYIITILEVS